MHYHEASFNEVVGLLINEKKMSFEDAKKAMKQFIDEFNVECIKRDDKSKEYEEIVKKANEEVVKEYGEDYRIGDVDIKVNGALNRKLKVIIIPEENRPDIEMSDIVPPTISSNIVRYAKNMDDVLEIIFGEGIWEM